jgi:hypothetical protein
VLCTVRRLNPKMLAGSSSASQPEAPLRTFLAECGLRAPGEVGERGSAFRAGGVLSSQLIVMVVMGSGVLVLAKLYSAITDSVTLSHNGHTGQLYTTQ